MGTEPDPTQTKNLSGCDQLSQPIECGIHELREYVDAAEPKVTQGARERLADLLGQWSTFEEEKNDIVAKEMNAYNALYKSLNLPAIILDKQGAKGEYNVISSACLPSVCKPPENTGVVRFHMEQPAFRRHINIRRDGSGDMTKPGNYTRSRLRST